MQASGLPGRILSTAQRATGMISLETPLHNAPAPAAQMVAFSAHTPHTHPSAAASDDDDPVGSANDTAGNDPKRKAAASQWHRMKWTDTMVKLLIMAVYYIGDEAASTEEATNKNNNNNNKASSSKALLQKKGKWKLVSKAMMEKGHCVSPQQCEDKFNDLNKRYKRVNEILGKGTACRVVENQGLLESMDLPLKMKEEAKKLLNSKHLFFREMCAYHHTCSSSIHHHHQSPGNQDPSHDEDEDLEEEWEDLDLDSEEGKRGREEVEMVMGDGGRTAAEKRRWVELEEEGVRYEEEGLEIEKERWKWVRFSRNKEMEFEKKMILNKRLRVENQRLLLLLRQKELQILFS